MEFSVRALKAENAALKAALKERSENDVLQSDVDGTSVALCVRFRMFYFVNDFVFQFIGTLYLPISCATSSEHNARAHKNS